MRAARIVGFAVLATAALGAFNPLTAQFQLVWENQYANGATPGPVSIGGTTVSIAGLDVSGVGSPGNFTVTYATRGAHSGYWESGLDATNRAQLLTFALRFSRPVETLEFSMLDIDSNLSFHDSITVVGWNGTTPFAPTTVGLGFAVAQVGPGTYSGRTNVDNGSTGANVDLRFGQLVDSVTFRYGPGPNADANPALQVMGLSDLSWTLPCTPTVTVGTVAELRAAVVNPCVTLVLIRPGTYALTTGGSGPLVIDQDITLRNAGGGEVVLDAQGASGVVEVERDNTVVIDGLTITGGSENNGAGIYTEGDLTLRNSTITGNTGRNGAGLFHRRGFLLLENVTVSGNRASNDGGGLDLRDDARLVHVTVASNSADQGGGLRSRDNSVTLVNTIVADNASNSGGQIRGNITALGVNVVEGGCSGCRLLLDRTGDPSLLPLALNGGNSRTHALAPGSIAVDAGGVTFGLPTDQRGVGRPVGLGYDIGAYEATLAISVSVTAAAATSSRLPSNGTGYSETFTVTNTGLIPSAFTLRATVNGTAVVVDSIRGPGVTYGAPADSARITLLLPTASVGVTVHYSVLDVPAGTSDQLTLTATSTIASSAVDSDVTTVTVVRPFLGMTKIATVAGDTVPGAPITYQMTVTNLGSEAAAQVVVVDSLPPMVEFLVSSTSETLPGGITATLEFDDGTDSWTYAPVPGACGGSVGYDRCVRAIRWTLDAPLPAWSPDNSVVFAFIAGIL